ncbi:hypothetical protein CBR_g30449 [Chara braunii]|uniref:Integrase zinc-binding domain-containing protein n=1 Tax=Chara braunii TaxID=69332 RepID=A0A388LD10_CHABU|nr:hypothetical protein CBR_g30449 [Chara braunii]|eukprot:GBG80082.1 hypothetical protein CBR_g30449 [Chara braunii]
MSDEEDTREDDRILRSARRPIAHLALGLEGDRYLFCQRRDRLQQLRRARAEASRALGSEAATSEAMGPGQTQWVPKTAIAAPKPFTGDKRGENVDTWLRAVPVYVKCKLTLQHEEVFVAASYPKGSATRWLSGLVQLQGYGHDFRSWAAHQKLEDFLKMVEERWHDPREAKKATGAILTLHTRQFKSTREAIDVVKRLICVPGVRYDPQVLLTSYLRCFPMPLRNQLAGEANINIHNFPSFSKKALDLEVKIGYGHNPTTDGRKKTLLPNWKAKGRIMLVDSDGSTIELDDNFQGGVGSKAGNTEASEGGVVAAVAQKGALKTEFDLADNVTQSLVEAYREDPFMFEIIRRLEAKDKVTSIEFELVKGLLFLEKPGNKRLCVPNKESLRSLFLGECHDATDHFGYKKTTTNLLQRFWWPTMMRDAQLYVETCQVCQRDKPRTLAPLGLSKPLPILERPGESLSMDFMDTLVTSY